MIIYPNFRSVRSKFSKLIIFLLIIGTTSCSDFKLPFPIDNSDNSEINEKLIGNWLLMSSNDSIRYPILHAEIFKFNSREYVATCKYLENQGREINSVSTCKIFNSILKENEYFNLQLLNVPKNNFFFFIIDENFIDSIHLRIITDSLKIEFKNSSEFRRYLENEDSLIQKGILGKPFPLYKWKSLNWDMVNKIDRSVQFDKLFLFGQTKEEQFLNLSYSELEEVLKNKRTSKIKNLKAYFENINLTSYSKGIFWKVPKFGVIKLRSGKLIKVKYDSRGSNFFDITNNRLYRNMNKEKIN